MNEDVKSTARKFFIEQDRLRGGPAPELCADDYMAYLAGYPPMDFQGHAGFAATFYDAFPDLRHTIQEVVTDRERATVRLHITGTNTESFMGMPATGKSIDIGVLVLMRIGGGKVSEIYGEFDQLGLMQQIGAVPAQVG